MTRCKISEIELMAWLDGEAGERSVEIERHVDGCEACAAKTQAWRAQWVHSQEALNGLVDDGLGDVEPLVALQKIRGKIEAQEEASLTRRFEIWWRDLWTFNRRALVGLGVAAIVGVLSAPAVLYVGQQQLGDDPGIGSGSLASVVVESLEFSGN